MSDATPPLTVFRAGTYQAMAGQTITLTAADLVACAAAYDPARHEAPLVVGHPVHNGPAYGWVASLAATDETLRATPRDVAVELAEAVRARRYAKLSASFWPPAHPANPAPGVWSLRHVGFLGAAVPAVLGLDPVTLAADEADLVTIDLSSPPAAPVAPHAEPAMPDPVSPDPTPTVDLAAREAEMQARESALAAREAELQAREQAATAQAEALRRAEIASFVGGLVEQGRLLPSEQAPLVTLLMSVPPAPSADFAAPVESGEPTPRAAAEWLREWLPRLPVRVPYGEFAAPSGADPEAARIEAAARVMAGLPPIESK